MNNCVEVKAVSKSYGTKKVLENISMVAQKGQIIGLLGPSGAGKTTLVNCIIGMVALNKGEIRIFDEKMPNLSLMKRIGFMAQSDALYLELCGIDNVVFFARLNGMKKKAAFAEAEEIMKLVGLYEDRNVRVLNYSGGMKRRLSLAVALMNNPELLILDEPTVGIDPVLRQVFWEEFNRRKEQGVAIILTTHVMDEAEKCDTLGLISDGRFIAYDSPVNIRISEGTSTIEEAFIQLSNKTRNERMKINE